MGIRVMTPSTRSAALLTRPNRPGGCGAETDGAAAATPSFLSQEALRLTAEVFPC